MCGLLNGVSFPEWHYNLTQMRDFLKETLQISLVTIYLLKVNRLYFLNDILKILEKHDRERGKVLNKYCVE